jgi:hypothetical protein
MIAIVNPRVTGFSVDYQVVYWEVPPHAGDPQDYVFKVEAGEAEYGPYSLLMDWRADTYLLRDTDPMLRNRSRTRWYVVTVREESTGETYATPPFCRRGELSRHGAEMARQLYVMWTRVYGESYLLFPRKSFGPICRSCTDHLTLRVRTRNCPVCYGTSYVGGYHAPVVTYGALSDAEEAIQLSETGHTEHRNKQIQLVSSPEVRPGDVLVDGRNERYRVAAVTGPMEYSTYIHYQCGLVRVATGDVEHHLPVPPAVEWHRRAMDGRGVTVTLERAMPGTPRAGTMPGGRR